MSLFLADLVLVVHLAFVLFAALGGLLALRWRRAPWLHLPAAAWGAYIELSGGICPLTPLENRLREAAGSTGYEGDFIGHYLVALLYPDGLTREAQFVLAALLVVLNVAVYTMVWRRRHHPSPNRDPNRNPSASPRPNPSSSPGPHANPAGGARSKGDRA